MLREFGHKENNGVRIYGDDSPIEKIYVSRHKLKNGEKRNFHIEEINDEVELKINNYSVASQEVLDIIDENINKLRVKKSSDNIISNNSKNHVNIDDPKTVVNDSCPKAKILALDHYIKQNISGQSGECGCHFQHGSVNPNLLNKLDVHYQLSHSSLINKSPIKQALAKRDRKESENPIYYDQYLDNDKTNRANTRTPVKTNQQLASYSEIENGDSFTPNRKYSINNCKCDIEADIVNYSALKGTNRQQQYVESSSSDSGSFVISSREDFNLSSNLSCASNASKDSSLLNELNLVEPLSGETSFQQIRTKHRLDSTLGNKRSASADLIPTFLTNEDEEELYSETSNALESLIDSIDDCNELVEKHPLTNFNSEVNESQETSFLVSRQTSRIGLSQPSSCLYHQHQSGARNNSTLSISRSQNSRLCETSPENKQHISFHDCNKRHHLFGFEDQAEAIPHSDYSKHTTKFNSNNLHKSEQKLWKDSPLVHITDVIYLESKLNELEKDGRYDENNLASVERLTCSESCYCYRFGKKLRTSESEQGAFNRIVDNTKLLISSSEASNRRRYDVSEYEDLDSMRAVKEIAKMSTPALSSLQYLPSQINTHCVTRETKQKLTNNESIKDNRAGSSENRVDKNEDNQRIQTESNEELRHHESCLLDRICLCTCMMRNSEAAEHKTTNNAGIEARTVERKTSSLKNLKQSKSCSKEERSKNELSRESRNENSGFKLKEVSKQEYEKQSPSFLNLLKPSQHISHNLDKLSKAQRVRQDEYKKLRSGSTRSTASESLSRNSAYSGNELESTLERSRTQSRSPSYSSYECRLRSSLSSSSVGQGLEIMRPQSACSSRESIKTANKRGSSYTKFFSPTKLFASKSSSQHQVSGQVEPLGDANKREHQSFFTRSLNRLSSRKKSTKGKINEGNPRLSDLSPYTCISPSPSITVSLVSAIESPSLTNSFCSLNQAPYDLCIEKDHSSLSPQVVSSRIEYLNNHPRQVNRSNDMTKSCPVRHGSERQLTCSCPTPPVQSQSRSDSSTSSFTQNWDAHAYSLPTSPRPSRRRVNCYTSSSGSKSPRLTHSPVEFHSPATQSTKIEDGLKVCSSEHFEKHIDNIKGDQVEIQKNLFKAWINHFCPNLIQRDLVDELKDGIKLIGLLAHLTRDEQLFIEYGKLNRDAQSYINRIVTTPSSRLRHLSNVTIAINYLREKRSMKLINLNPMDIVGGNQMVILGLCWNIILNFQLEQNFFKCQDDSSVCDNSSSSSNNYSTSHLSETLIKEDRAKEHIRNRANFMNYHSGGECTSSDLAVALNKLLVHINNTFNLKLTNSVSNLLDGDVLLLIIKGLIKQRSYCTATKLQEELENKTWKMMTNEEKLDYCFRLADTHLHVPQLFCSADIKQQSVSDNNLKPLIVYLTMLLNANSASANQMKTGLYQSLSDEQLTNFSTFVNEKTEDTLNETMIEKFIEEINKFDKFDLEKICSTLEKIKKLEEIIKKSLDEGAPLKKSIISNYELLVKEAKQVEDMISWINEANSLFQIKQTSANDLAQSIKEYREFFSNNKPLDTSVCSNLECQYRECLATARQRIILMEQTFKNWSSYEKTRERLGRWLITAESKLTNALPRHQPVEQNSELVQHKIQLEELIKYFELEPIETILNESDLAKEWIEKRSDCGSVVMDIDEVTLNKCPSVSTSMLSLGSNSSKLSLLQCSKKATYNKLFDDFELRCRLLAAMLDCDQRDALLIGVRELKSRFKYITEQRVPQVVSELKLNISGCETKLREQDYLADGKIVNSQSTNALHHCLNSIKAYTKVKPLARVRQTKSTKKNSLTKELMAKEPKSSEIQNSSTSSDNSKPIPYISLLWNKILLASRTSISLNIFLLICLTGICIVPIMHKQSCCELLKNYIPSGEFSLREKPT